MAGPRITIDGIVTMDGEVLVDREATNAGPRRVWRALQFAGQQIDDQDLHHAWIGGVGRIPSAIMSGPVEESDHKSRCAFISCSCWSYETVNPTRSLTSLHALVVDSDAGDNARELLVASDAHELAEELGAESLTLKGVGDEHGEFRLVRAPQLHQAADGQDDRLSRRRRAVRPRAPSRARSR